MATTTRENLRKLGSQATGDYFSSTTTSAGGNNKRSLIDVGLANRAEQGDTGAFDGMYILVTSGANDGESRRVENYSPKNTQLYVTQPFTAQVATSVTYELHRYDPVLKHEAIDLALLACSAYLYIPKREYIIIDDILSNSDFEDTFSSGHPSWTEVGSPTVTAETSTVYSRSQSAKVVAGSGAAGQLTQTPSVNLNESAGLTATFKRRVWASAGSTARIRLDWGGSNFENSDYHEGDAEWELLSVSAAIPTDATQVKVICEVVASGTGYFDGGGGTGLSINPIYKYTIPASLTRGPFFVEQQHSENDINGTYYPFPNDSYPTSLRAILLRGTGILSTPSTDSGTTEIGEPHLRLFVAQYKYQFYSLLASPTRSAQRQRDIFQDAARDALAEFGHMAVQRQFRKQRSGAHVTSAWGVQEDVDGRYLIFRNSRAGTSGIPGVL